jgi:hypothetical protein
LIVPSTVVLPRDGSFALAFLGRVRVHDPAFAFALDRDNLALKQIVDLVSCSLASFIPEFSMAFLASRSKQDKPPNPRPAAPKKNIQNSPPVLAVFSPRCLEILSHVD